MLWNARYVGSIVQKYALLLLAFCVFCFGLNARLEQYKTFPPNPTAAKISTEKHLAQTLKALDKQDEPANGVDRLALVFLLAQVRTAAVFHSVSEQAKIDLYDPRRLNLDSVPTLHGPPSKLA